MCTSTDESTSVTIAILTAGCIFLCTATGMLVGDFRGKFETRRQLAEAGFEGREAAYQECIVKYRAQYEKIEQDARQQRLAQRDLEEKARWRRGAGEEEFASEDEVRVTGIPLRERIRVMLRM